MFQTFQTGCCVYLIIQLVPQIYESLEILPLAQNSDFSAHFGGKKKGVFLFNLPLTVSQVPCHLLNKIFEIWTGFFAKRL